MFFILNSTRCKAEKKKDEQNLMDIVLLLDVFEHTLMKKKKTNKTIKLYLLIKSSTDLMYFNVEYM